VEENTNIIEANMKKKKQKKGVWMSKKEIKAIKKANIKKAIEERTELIMSGKL